MAAKTGQRDAVRVPVSPRAVCPRKRKTAVYSRLEESPGSFAFAQAVHLIRRYLSSQGVTDPKKALRFRVNPNLSFPPGDMESLTFTGQGEETKALLVLNLMGLHGAGSPLPVHFSEHVAQHQDDADALRDFFDLFNHEFIDILYGAWQKYRYYLQYEEGAEDDLSRRFLGFIGMGYDQLRKTGGLNWSRLLAYMGLIAFKSDAAGSLESTLRHYFAHSAVHVVQCIRRIVDIPEDQLCRLGMANCRLEKDCLIGDQVPDQTGKFRILISDLSWGRFNSFLPDQTIFAELAMVVKMVLRSRLQFDVELRLRPEEIRPLVIGETSETKLGWSTWLGEGGDGVVVLEPGYQENVC